MKINLFFFISDFNFGGASNSIFNFLNKVDKKKFKIFMIFIGSSNYKKILPKTINVINVKTYSKKFSTITSFFQIRKIVKSTIKRNAKNVFISNIHYSNIISIFFLRKIANLKLIIFERTSFKELDLFLSIPNFLKNRCIKFLLKPMYKKADQILTNSKVLSKELLKKGLKSKVVYSATIKKIIPKKRFKKKLFFNLISVGRLTHQKDYKTIIKSIKLVKRKNFKLKIYGNGNLKKSLENFVKINNLNNQIEILGHEKDKKKIYNNADLLIHAAIFEGLPNNIVEAINYSVPIIASKSAGGTAEILGNGKYGTLFETKNYKQLAKKIDDFLEDPSKLQKKVLKGRKELIKFKFSNTTKNLERIINQLF